MMDFTNFLTGVADAAEHNRTQRSGDFVDEEGFIRCGICGERKQTVLEFGAMRGRKVFCMCACDLKVREREEQNKLAEAVKQRKQRCFSHTALWNNTFENDSGEQPQMKLARQYTDHWDEMREKNVGLIFLGDVGTGKSYAACAIANALCERDIPTKFINFSEILNELQNCEDRNRYLKKLTEYSLLIIDDFGAERNTEYAIEQLFNVIDQRCQSRKPLIITTNLTLDELRNPIDTKYKRIYDRVLQLGTPVLFGGKSLRQIEREEKRKFLTDVFSK